MCIRDSVWVDVPSRLFLRWPRLPAWDGFVIRCHAQRCRRQLHRGAPLVAYVCHPIFEQYIGALRPDYVVYHCYDLYARQPGWTTALEAAERRLLARADMVFS